MLSIRLDLIDSRRFVCLDVDPSYGSRFARHLEKNCKLVNRAWSKMLPIRLDSIDSRRFVCLDVDPSYRKSICATFRVKLQVG